MTPEDWENLAKRGKTAVQGAALKLATDAIETLEEWQKPRDSRFRGNLLTEDEYEAMLEAQVGVCAICKEKPKGSRLAVDHVHGTDQVRGLLCNLCNPALGLFKDNPDSLKRAIEDLERGGSRSAGPSERVGLGEAHAKSKARSPEANCEWRTARQSS